MTHNTLLSVDAFIIKNCNAAAASFVRHGSQEIPIFIIGCVVYLSMVQ